MSSDTLAQVVFAWLRRREADPEVIDFVELAILDTSHNGVDCGRDATPIREVAELAVAAFLDKLGAQPVADLDEVKERIARLTAQRDDYMNDLATKIRERDAALATLDRVWNIAHEPGLMAESALDAVLRIRAYLDVPT